MVEGDLAGDRLARAAREGAVVERAGKGEPGRAGGAGGDQLAPAKTPVPGPCVRLSHPAAEVTAAASAMRQLIVIEPGAGLEPATPSLPWRCSTN